MARFGQKMNKSSSMVVLVICAMMMMNAVVEAQVVDEQCYAECQKQCRVNNFWIYCWPLCTGICDRRPPLILSSQAQPPAMGNMKPDQAINSRKLSPQAQP